MAISHTSIFYCGFIRRKINNLRFNWTRRRSLWRASFYYNVVSWILIIGIILTFLFHYLITQFNFFVNYSCSSRSIRMIGWYIITLIVMTGASWNEGHRLHRGNPFLCLSTWVDISVGTLLLVSIFLARMCNMFSNYTLSDFMSTGKWLDVFGCTVKWFPWLSAILMWLWLIIQFSSLIWVFVNSRQWCEHRFNESAVNAVKNCRLILNGTLPCKIDLGTIKHKEIRECNHPGYLIRRKIMLLALKDNNSRCSIEDDLVCKAFRDAIADIPAHVESSLPQLPETSAREEVDPNLLKDYVLELGGHVREELCSNMAVSWDSPSLSGCLGKLPSSMDEYFDTKNSSDLYKYVLLFNITWSSVYVVIVCFFYFVKSVTTFDAIVYQPKDPSDNITIKVIRPFTPWTD